MYEKNYNKQLSDKIIEQKKSYKLKLEKKDLEIGRIKKLYTTLNATLNQLRNKLKSREKERDDSFKRYTEGLNKVKEFEKMENTIIKMTCEIAGLKQELKTTSYQKSSKGDWEESYKKLKEEYKTVQSSSFEVLGNFQAFLMADDDEDDLREIYNEMANNLKDNMTSMKKMMKDMNFISD